MKIKEFLNQNNKDKYNIYLKNMKKILLTRDPIKDILLLDYEGLNYKITFNKTTNETHVVFEKGGECILAMFSCQGTEARNIFSMDEQKLINITKVIMQNYKGFEKLIMESFS